MLALRRNANLPANRIAETMDRLFDNVFEGLPFPSFFQPATGQVAWLPPVDLWEDDAHLYVEADLPGMTLEDLEVLVKDDTLILRGTRKLHAPGNATVFRQERLHGTFERTFRIPYDIQRDKVEAEFDKGVLRVRIPKAESAQARRIEIKCVPSNNG